MKNIPIREFLEAPFEKRHGAWYDWFCKDTALPAKTEKLTTKLAQIANSPRINQDTMYVFFKNNCPMNGPLYDDFRVCDIASGDVIFTITPRCGHSGKAEVWGKLNDFKEPIIQGSWIDVKNFFMKG